MLKFSYFFAGEPPQTGTATLTVTVDDLNDNAPDFVPPTPRPTVSATALMNSEVARFDIYDPDSEENGPPFTLEYICNDPACQDFTLQSGKIICKEQKLRY